MINKINYLNNFYFEPNQTVQEKFAKMLEEIDEVIDARDESLTGVGTNSMLSQEILDMILTSVNLLKKLDSEDLISLDIELGKHFEKLEDYKNSGKYEV